MSDRQKTEDAAWKAWTGVLQDYPFYAFILQQMRRLYVPADKAGNLKVAAIAPTAGGKFILLLNEESYHNFPIAQQIGILRHEAGHPMVMTWGRGEGRHPKLWNIATDMRINVDLERDSPQGRGALPDWVCYPDSDQWKFPLDETCEYYYNKLHELAPKINLIFGAPEKGEGEGDEKGGGGGKSEGGDEGEGSGESNSIDVHVQWGSGDGHEIPEDLKDWIKDQLGGDEVTDNENIAKGAIKTILENAVNEVKTTGRGTVPASALMQLKKLEYQSYKFEGHLRRWMQKTLGRRKRVSWSRPNRRMPDFPGRKRSNGLHLIIIKDTSGSMDLKIRQICSGHIDMIMRTTGAKITVVDNDAGYGENEQLRHYEYRGRQDNNKLLQECGGGGTAFTPAFEFIKKQKWDPSGILYFTDGWAESTMPDPPCPVLFCVPADRGPLSLLNGPEGDKWADSVCTLPPIDK